MNAILYVLPGGIAWRLLPSDLPSKSTALRWFAAWRDPGLFEAINHMLVMADRELVGREGHQPASATSIPVEIVRKPPDPVGFAVHLTHWVVKLLR